MFALLDPRVWVVVLILLAGSYGAGRWQQWRADEQGYQAARLAATEAARATEQAWATHLVKVRDDRDKEIKRISAARDDAMRKLRDRPERLPETARTACEGATGAELSIGDAGFLVGLAARADELRADLLSCQQWIEAVSAEPAPPH